MDSYSENSYTCKLCGQVVSEKKHFWKRHKMAEAKYFEQHDSKKDLLTDEIIPFKSYESYLQTDFTKRTNLKKYLENIDKDGATEYLCNWLEQRKKLKKLIFAPSQFEIRGMIFPVINYIEKKFGKGTYAEICEYVGLLLNFNYKETLFTSSKNLHLIIDTREQSILKFDDFSMEKLDVGDYTVKGSNIFVERKSLTDFLGTMSQGYDRFNREIERAVVSDKYVVVVVEEKYSNLHSYPYLPHAKKVKAEPTFIHHRVREMLQKYPFNLQFIAVNGRREASRVIENIFRMTNNVRQIDLQYLYDRKEL